MRKNNLRDYATAAFRFWGRCGSPSVDEIKSGKHEWDKAERLDLMACAMTFTLLKKRGDELICDAVRDVYMTDPDNTPRRGDISAGVIRFSLKVYVSERQVYNWLRDANTVFGKYRNLRFEK